MADYFNSLPLEISLDILGRLPTETALGCKLVCKSWNTLVRHPSFHRIHLDRLNLDDSGKLDFLSSTGYIVKHFEYNENSQSNSPIERSRRVNLKLNSPFTSIVGSINGLICLARSQSVCICNPITREHVMLPEIQTQHFDTHQYYNWTSGFGYISSTNEYKVVAIHASTNEYKVVEHASQAKFIEVNIYTLGSGKGWRNLGRFDIDFGEIYFGEFALEQGIFVNGAIYWIGSAGCDLEMIFKFDLIEEKFCQHLAPPTLPPAPNGEWSLNKLGVLEGFLYFAVWLIDETGGNVWYDIWRLEKMNDMKEKEERQSWGWTKMFRLQEKRLVAIMKNGSVLTHFGSSLYIYGPKSCTSKRRVDLKACFREIFPHKSTFVSLKEFGEEDTEIMESIEIKKTESHDSPMKQLEEEEALDALFTLKESGGKETESRDLSLEQLERRRPWIPSYKLAG